VQKEVTVACKRWWGDPGNRVPTGRRWCQARETTNVHGRIQHPNMHLIQHKHLFTDSRLGVIPSKSALMERIEFGGRGTHVEGEVVVHGVVVRSSGSGDGS